MLRRKKRIPYDPPGERTGRRRPDRPRRADQIFINRRVLMIRGAVIGGFTVLAGRLAQMQIARGDTYQKQAVDNVVSWKERKPTRGLIYDRVGRPLAENRRTWEVRIIPAKLPKRGTAEYESVRERLITALRLPDCLIIDRNAVPKGTELTVFTRVAIQLGATTQQDVDDWVDYIEASAKYNYVVLVDSELSADLAAKIKAYKSELPGVEVVNYFDYLVRNFRFFETPVTVKRDVARDVALKLEANRLYLPGVELDDSVLTRRYPGGPVMSHILGYVGKIQDQDLNDPDNILRIDQTTGRRYYKVYQPDDSIGQAGIERKLEEVLRGQKGGSYFEQDSSGVVIRELGNSAPAVPGKNLRLSVDLELQATMSRALAEGITFSDEDRAAKFPEKPAVTRGGAVVMLSPKTGEVYALVSYPTYDNQLFIDGLSVLKAKEYGLTPNPELAQKKLDLGERYVPDGVTDPLTDRAYASHYAPGSTLKLFVALAGLRERVIDVDKRYSCTGAIVVPWTWNEAQGTKYPCWISRTGSGHGAVNVVEALEQSCDVFFYNVGTPAQKPEGADLALHYRDYNMASGAQGDTHYFEGLGIDKLHKNLYKRFWFGEQTRIDLPFEAFGLVPNQAWKMDTLKDGWSSGDTINTSIGQGFFLASPLQMAVNTAALANGGLILRPRIVHSIVDDQGTEVQDFKAEKLRRLKMNPEQLGLVLEGMRRVVHAEAGTANHSLDPETGEAISKWPLTNPPGEEEIIIAGKTGTAEVGYQMDDGSYSEAHAWFTCFAPMDDPEVVVTVFLERGGEGSSYAVPIADKALRAYFETTGRRSRGLVLRGDQQPINDENPPPDGEPVSDATPDANATPEA